MDNFRIEPFLTLPYSVDVKDVADVTLFHSKTNISTQLTDLFVCNSWLWQMNL